MSYLYRFDGEKLTRVETPAARLLRWAAWRPDGRSALLVGNGGEALEYDGKSFRRFDAGTRHNLRGAAWSPDGRTALLVGNRGAVLAVEGGRPRELASPTGENLRRVAWRPDGAMALIVGNAGVVLRYEPGGAVEPVPGDRAHTLRTVAWRPDGAYALVGAYASRLAGYPRPHSLYRCDGRYLQALLATDDEDDFVAIDWRRDGPSAEGEALIAGYAYRAGGAGVSKLVTYDGAGFRSLQVEAPGLLWGAAWRPQGEDALLLGERGCLMWFDGQRARQVASGTNDNLVGPFWRPDGAYALILKGPDQRVYTV